MSESHGHDLSVDEICAIWQNHTMAEFAFRDADQAVTTLTEDAHVLMVPIRVGGVGREAVRRYYADQFLAQLPPDMEVVPVSRTVGQGQLVDEAVYRFTHSLQMDWFLPGVPPTGKRIEFAVVGIIRFRDGLICSEHLYWDHASVLAQIGLIDAAAVGAGVQDAEGARHLLQLSQPPTAA